MAGFDRFTREKWEQIYPLAENSKALGNLAEMQPDYAWVNAVAIWVREKSGLVRLYLQPKLKGAASERETNMLQGDRILYFQTESTRAKPQGWRLTQMICYDFIMEQDGWRLPALLRQQLAKQSATLETDLVVVLQANDKPGSNRFWSRAQELLEPRAVASEPAIGAVLFNNVALHGSQIVTPDDVCERDTYGTSGFVFHERVWRAAPADLPLEVVPRVIRRRKVENKEIVFAGFRALRPAVHIVKYHSGLIPKPPNEQTTYLEDCKGLPLHTFLSLTGERVQMQTCTALQHVIELAWEEAHPENKNNSLSNCFVGAAGDVMEGLVDAHRVVAQRIGSLTGPLYERLKTIVQLLLQTDVIKNPDEWSAHQYDALVGLMHSLTLFLALKTDLDLSRQAEPQNQRQIAVTAQSPELTLSVMAGMRGSYKLILQGVLPENWELLTNVQPHLYFFLDSAPAPEYPNRVDPRELKRAGAGAPHPVQLKEDDRFGPLPGQQVYVASGPPFYWFSLLGLISHIYGVDTFDDLKRRLEAVLKCLAA